MEESLTITTLNEVEMTLFARYHGVTDLEKRDDFWDHAFKVYAGEILPLPMAYNPPSVRYYLDCLKCRPGECGGCCHYGRIDVRIWDIERILESGLVNPGELDKLLQKDKDGALYFDGSKGCPMLEENACRIYRCRPDVCYLFPLQGSSSARVDGKQINQMTMKIQCRQSWDVARKIITATVLQTNGMLLPNMQVIKREV
jgi:Fe-S-cluster containining protein